MICIESRFVKKIPFLHNHQCLQKLLVLLFLDAESEMSFKDLVFSHADENQAFSSWAPKINHHFEKSISVNSHPLKFSVTKQLVCEALLHS